MHTITVNNHLTYKIEADKNNPSEGLIDGVPYKIDAYKVNDQRFHILHNNQGYRIEIIRVDFQTKTFEITVNSNRYTITAEDQFQALLKQLGMDKTSSIKLSELKAPMPGLVIDCKVKAGDSVQKGDPLIVLEAMKMENSLKSPQDGVIKKIFVTKGTAVEKNQVLLSFN